MLAEPAEVLARWAYSDIAGAHAAAYDAAPEIDALRSKRRAGVGFHDLTPVSENISNIFVGPSERL